MRWGAFVLSELERKALHLDLKADEEGSFKAVFATLGVVDNDGDVTVAGAFKDSAEVVIGSYGHNMRELPIGKGLIRAAQSEAAVEGKFFLDTDRGRQTYQTVKNLGSLQSGAMSLRSRSITPASSRVGTSASSRASMSSPSTRC